MSEEKRERFLNTVKEASRDKFVLSEWESDKMAELVEYQSLKNARQEGVSQGIEKNTIDTIKSMLKKKMTYEDISDITGKSIEEIKEIEKSVE